MQPSTLSRELRAFNESLLSEFPWEIVVTDWSGASYRLGRGKEHWYGSPLNVMIKTEGAARDLLGLNALRFLDRFLLGEVDLTGNLYLLSDIRCHANLHVPWWKLLPRIVSNRSFIFQTIGRASVNVRSHYDIPQESLGVYLDKTFKSYSCAIFDDPHDLNIDELKRAGSGRTDNFDSLEKAQWRKFKDAVDYVRPEAGDELLDIGCGYGGQLQVALEEYPQLGKAVGWTHSRNQITAGRKMLSRFDSSRWEMNEGDYRQERRQFDHVTSTGMVSHVGPRGLEPYVRNIRNLIKRGGRYVHHSLMTPHMQRPLDSDIGVAFNKRYVWPGFHWFSLGDHVAALEQNDFVISRLVNLSPHYAKTTAAWYERMMARRDSMSTSLGEKTFRAWQIYLSGACAGFLNNSIHVYRLYCTRH